MASEPILSGRLNSLVTDCESLLTSNAPAIAIAGRRWPAGHLDLVATPLGLVGLAAYLLAHAKGGPSKAQEELFAKQWADCSWAIDVKVVEALPAATHAARPSRRFMAGMSAVMLGIWVSSLFFWAVGVYACVMWLVGRAAS